MEIIAKGYSGFVVESMKLADYVSQVISRTSSDQGALEDVENVAENSSVVLGKLIEKLVEKDVLSLDDVKDIVYDFSVTSLEKETFLG